MFFLKVRTKSIRKTSVNELNEIFINMETKSESGSEFIDESDTDEYNDPDTESSIYVSNGKHTSLACGSTRAS